MRKYTVKGGFGVIFCAIAALWVLKHYEFENPKIQKITRLLFNKQDIVLFVDDTLTQDSISIYCKSREWENVVVHNGKVVRKPRYDYGNCSFEVYYHEKLIGVVGHYKNRWYHNHTYFFRLFKQDGRIQLDFKASGPNYFSSLFWHKQFHPDQYKCNDVVKHSPFKINVENANPKLQLNLKIDTIAYHKILNTVAEKFPISTLGFDINDVPQKVDYTKIIGNTSINYRRKYYKIKLDKSYRFTDGARRVKLKKFKLISLSMDHYYYRNYFAYSLLQKLGLFDVYFTFIDLKLNGRSEGIYLLVEDVGHDVKKRKDAPFYVRRDYRFSGISTHGKPLDFKYEKKHTPIPVKKYIQAFEIIYKHLRLYSGKELYDTLNAQMDLTQYYKWLAFNYLMCDGDYTDEVYFYTTSVKKPIRFHIVPWDYDDIFNQVPHEHWKRHYQRIGTKMLYSSEDTLDVVIANDPYLYGKYVQQLEQVVNDVDPNTILNTLLKAQQYLAPLYHKPNCIEMSKYDQYGTVTYDQFVCNLMAVHRFLTQRRGMIERQIETCRKKVD